ncbi:Uncharacterized protein RNJ44_00835 [Nakaseomyces bracarensis]|uniref:Dolichol phosphate-mannose biosynthesis regulatory protein n=1 Tax=Nakaseomyces bracarensis TaxID=273131 RepID=A0ABR4NS81_9SACH
MKRLAADVALFVYYIAWLLLPLLELEGQWPWLFPLPSQYAIYLPIFLLLVGFTIVGTYLSYILLKGK